MDSFKACTRSYSPAGILRDTMFHKMTDQDWDLVHRCASQRQFTISAMQRSSFPRAGRRLFRAFHFDVRLIGNIGQAKLLGGENGIVGLSRIIAMEGLSKMCART